MQKSLAEQLRPIPQPTRGSLSLLMEASFDSMVLVSERGLVLEVNSAALDLIGKKLAQVRGMSVETVIKLQPHTGPIFPRLPSDAPAFVGSLCTLQIEGRTSATVLLKKTPCMSTRTLWVLRDVSTTQPILKALDRKNRLLLEAERVGRIGGWEYDPSTRMMTWTRELQRLMGMTEGSLTFEHSNMLYVGDSADRVREAFKVSLRDGIPYDLELEVMTGDGRRMWIREVCRPTIHRGKLTSVVGVVQDISESRHMACLLAQCVDRERTRFAADLHDGVGQELTGLALELEGAAAEYRKQSPGTAREFAHLSKIARGTLGRLRETSHALLPVELRKRCFSDICRHLAVSIRSTLGVRVQFRFRGAQSDMPVDSTAEHLYRIAQEAVANAIKHGAARRVTISLTADESKLLLTISDNGSGINAASRKPGVGLHVMRYRARLLGGVLTLGASRRGGTQVRCVVPSRLVNSVCVANNTSLTSSIK